jgi:hypothetical protein
MNNKIGVRTKHSLRDFILEKQEENVIILFFRIIIQFKIK